MRPGKADLISDSAGPETTPYLEESSFLPILAPSLHYVSERKKTRKKNGNALDDIRDGQNEFRGVNTVLNGRHGGGYVALRYPKVFACMSFACWREDATSFLGRALFIFCSSCTFFFPSVTRARCH